MSSMEGRALTGIGFKMDLYPKNGGRQVEKSLSHINVLYKCQVTTGECAALFKGD